jgi:hypothetical protein
MRFFTYTGSNFVAVICPSISQYVASLRHTSPARLTDSSREATFTLSPTTVYTIRVSEPMLPETASPVLTPTRIYISANSGRLVAGSFRRLYSRFCMRLPAHTARRAPVSTAWPSSTKSFVTTRLTEPSQHGRCRAHRGSAWCQWDLARSSISSGAIRGCPAVAPDVAVPL